MEIYEIIEKLNKIKNEFIPLKQVVFEYNDDIIPDEDAMFIMDRHYKAFNGIQDMEIRFEGNSNNLNIGAMSLIPTEKIADTKPVNPPVNPDKPSKSGCGGSIALTASLMSMMALGAMAFLSIKKRKED